MTLVRKFCSLFCDGLRSSSELVCLMLLVIFSIHHRNLSLNLYSHDSMGFLFVAL